MKYDMSWLVAKMILSVSHKRHKNCNHPMPYGTKNISAVSPALTRHRPFWNAIQHEWTKNKQRTSLLISLCHVNNRIGLDWAVFYVPANTV